MIEALATPLLAAASGAKPAAGAPLDQLAALAAVNLGGTAALLWLVSRHRRGRTRLLARAGAIAGWVFRLPGWAALPVLIASVSLGAVMVGGFSDIGYHIDVGRDEGPLGNAGHWPMLFGFFGVLVSGVVAVALADRRQASSAWVRLAPGWPAPVGGLLLVGCGAFALLALPLDDVWHRIFGQDVTLWSPTHFMLLGGATFALIGMLVLVTEGARAPKPTASATAGNGRRPWARIELSGRDAIWARIELLGRRFPWARAEIFVGRSLSSRVGRIWERLRVVALLGAMLVGLEAFLAEYDWGVPLYRQVWQPLLLAAFAGFVFSAARGVAGPGGALGAWAVYLPIRLIATLMPVLVDRSAALLPLFLAEAACVELAALRFDPRRRPLAFGAAAGLLCGTVGFAAEYAWSQIAMPLPWNPGLLPEGVPSAALAGIAGGLLGALLAAALRGELPGRRVARGAFVGAFALLLGLGVNAGIRELPPARAHFELTEVRPEPRREALATVRLEPANAADGANWFYVLAWQGGSERIVDRLREVGDGIYRSTEPIPLYGSWKAGLRLQRGRERGSVPIRLPADAALPGSARSLPASFTSEQAGREAISESAGAELPAPAAFTRPFLDDSLIVLRETKGDVPRWLWATSIGLIFACYALFIGGLALGVARAARRAWPAAPAPPRAPGTAAAGDRQRERATAAAR